MTTIHRLDDITINKIAAGEVVEHPASVVKELVENAIDAGAKHISIDCTAGGLKRIVVSDDGRGMSPEDAAIAIERHATSKIRSAKDLESILTMGFRGEALASIGAVSKCSLTTSNGVVGTKISVHGGKVVSVGPAGRPRGTTVEVIDLFYSVPARKAFQKAPSSCVTEIHKVLVRLMLSSREVSFSFSIDGKIRLEAKSHDVETRVKEVLGPMEMQRVESEFVEGVVGVPSTARLNRTGQILFINNRWVVSPAVERAVKEGFGTRIEERKYPNFVLFVSLSPEEVDVNVHPQKREVRFSDEAKVKRYVRDAVASCFFSKGSERLPTFSGFTEVPASQPMFLQEEVVPTLFETQKPVYAVGKYQHYLLVDGAHHEVLGEGLFAVDLKKASMRVFYEDLEEEVLPLQHLTAPVIVQHTLQSGEANALLGAGLQVRPFGERETAIDALGAEIAISDAKAFFFEALECLSSVKRCEKLKLAALSHLKDNWESKSVAEGCALVQRLFKAKEPSICPRGTPTWRKLT